MPSPDSSHAEPARSALGLTLAVALITLVIDQLTKMWALAGLDAGSPKDLFWKLRLNLIYNEGSAFSLGRGFGPIIGVLAVIISIGLVLQSRKIQSRVGGVLLGLIVGGAIGNVIDRLFREGTESGFMRGAVIDFVDFQFWPVFNVADMAIVVGAIAMVLFGLRDPSVLEPDAAPETEDTAAAVGADGDDDDPGAESAEAEPTGDEHTDADADASS